MFLDDENEEELMSYLIIKNVEKTFGKFKALNNIDFEIDRGSSSAF